MIGIMGAMTQEVGGLIEAMDPDRAVVESGGRTFHLGRLFGRDVVVVFSRWGKVAAATTATQLLVAHGVEELVFTGVAGAVDPELRPGDVVVASALWQHDVDGSPIFPRHEIPLTGVSSFPADEARRDRAVAAAARFLGSEEAKATAAALGIRPRASFGEIASGDKFFADAAEVAELRRRLPGVRCVEMEGGAVAQVCHDHGVPLTVIRTVSDAGDEAAPLDFAGFVERVASRWSRGIVRELLAPPLP